MPHWPTRRAILSRLAQAQPCHIEPELLRTATDWMAQYRLMWEARLDRLDAFLVTLQPPLSPLPQAQQK